jgi:holo-[acyl-carrier protein] synthase
MVQVNLMPAKLRTGVDLIEIERFTSACQRHGARLLQRLFTPDELVENRGKTASMAARFAAKEAVTKALGTGIGKISWHDIEITRGSAGEPVLQLLGAAKDQAESLGLNYWSLSMSHTQEHAIAFVVAVGE